MCIRKMSLPAAVMLATVLVTGCAEDKQVEQATERSEGLPSELQNVTIVTPSSSAPAPVNPVAEPAKEEEERDRALKIGVIGPETGKDDSYGLSVLYGAMAAAKRFNEAGGVEGKTIEVVHFDNKDDPGLTREGIKSLIQQEVIAVLGAPTGWTTFAPTHMVNSSKTIFVAVGTRRRIGRSGPFVFRVALPDEAATDELIAYTSGELGYKQYAMVTASQYDYSLDLSSLFKQAVMKHGGMLKVDVDTYDTFTGQRNMEGVLEAIKSGADGLQGVIFTGGIEEALLLAEGLKQAGLHLPIIGGEDLHEAEYLQGGDAVTGSIVYATFSIENDAAKVDEFKQDYAEGSPDRFAALAYDVFMLLGEAVRSAGSTKPSQVREALVSIENFDGATGTTGFTSRGVPVKHPFIYGVKHSDSGESFALLKR